MLPNLIILTLLTFSISGNDPDTLRYNQCIESHPCQHDGKDLKKLHKAEYMKTMECRIKRHIECIKTDIERQNDRTKKLL
jgi:hypothetical protein